MICYENKSVLFFPMTKHSQVDMETLRRTLRVEHLGYYLSRPQSLEQSTQISLE